MISANPTQSMLALIGRVLLAAIFVMAGVQKVMDFSTVTGHITAHGLPYSELFTLGAIVCELGGGLMVLFGFYARFGALLLIIFVVIVSFVFHAFWTFSGAEMTAQMQHFMKNIAMAGGLLYVMSYGSGELSITKPKSKD